MLYMASCSYSALFESVSRCGASSKNPQNIQCVVISECTKEVYPHVKSLKIGPDEAIRDESTLLLARAGIFFYLFHAVSHGISLTVCALF